MEEKAPNGRGEGDASLLVTRTLIVSFACVYVKTACVVTASQTIGVS